MKTKKQQTSEREWVVFSTALRQGWLLLECRITGNTGTVRDPSEKEWNDAWWAPSEPYIWKDNSRVIED
jgi:hypothetical protein